MISVSEARAIMLDHVRRCDSESVPIREALGRTLAAPVTARRAQPPFRASAMDGYAVRSVDTPGVLRVVGEIGAGSAPTCELKPGECARIFTGAPLPEGADAVLIQEDARREGNCINAPRVEPHKHVRPVGIDFLDGAKLLDTPMRLAGPALALAAAAGRAEIIVVRKPRIAIIGGGDEIVPPNAEPGPAQIFDSASYGVAGLAQTWGADALKAPPYRDDETVMVSSIEKGLLDSGLTVVLGGASVGDHDHARDAIESMGAQLLFAKVAVRPGKPTWFAIRDGKAILGLPGNPTSAFVCARLFLRPLIERMLGFDPSVALATQSARLRRPLAANEVRETYLRARTERDNAGQAWATVSENQDSSLVSVFAASDALVVRAPDAPALDAEDIVQTLPI